MRFWCSENHLCAYHNHSYTGNVLPHCEQGRIYEVCLSSLLDYHLFRNTKYIFCKSFSPVIITAWKVLKEIYNIVASHLFTHEVFAVQWSLNETQITPEGENNTCERQWIWHSGAKSVGTQANYTVVRFFYMNCFFTGLIIWRCFVIVALSASRLYKWSEGFFL